MVETLNGNIELPLSRSFEKKERELAFNNLKASVIGGRTHCPVAICFFIYGGNDEDI